MCLFIQTSQIYLMFFDVFQSENEKAFVFDSLIVNELEAPPVQYSSTPGELEVTYQIGQHMIVPIYITANKTLSVYEGKPLVIHICGGGGGGDGIDMWFNLDVSATDNPALVDLHTISNYNVLTYYGRNTEYIIQFYPLNLRGVPESEFRTYNATPLKVYVLDKTPQDYKLKILGSSKISFKEGSDKVISVTANFNNTVEDSLKDKPMYLYINGEPIKLENVNAGNHSFKINLADYITKSGDYEISIHPREKLLKDTFGKNYTYNSVSVHYTVKTTPPAKDTSKDTSKPQVKPSGSGGGSEGGSGTGTGTGTGEGSGTGSGGSGTGKGGGNGTGSGTGKGSGEGNGTSKDDNNGNGTGPGDSDEKTPNTDTQNSQNSQNDMKYDGDIITDNSNSNQNTQSNEATDQNSENSIDESSDTNENNSKDKESQDKQESQESSQSSSAGGGSPSAKMYEIQETPVKSIFNWQSSLGSIIFLIIILFITSIIYIKSEKWNFNEF